ncbi:conserved hypothetical protein [Ricinus communis]|uniref:Uncharacterized protein n=1 Tax=Ricinus communis TaxID=3988 RepID=B9SAS9_RICCO|nr:conserved hypothetical protein [Ricinus communis]
MGIGFTDSNTQIVELAVFATQANSSYQRKVPAYGVFNGNKSFGVNRPPVGNSNGFRSQGGQRRFYNSNSNDKPMCTFCGFSGHTVEIYFKKHGYPLRYTPKSRTQAYVNQVGEFLTENDQESYYIDQE